MLVELVKDHAGNKSGYQFSTEDNVAKILIEQGIAKSISDNPVKDLIEKSMEGLLGNITKSINDGIEQAIKQFGDNLNKSRKNAVPAIFGQGGEGDPKKTFGAFLTAIYRKDIKALEEMGSNYVEWTDETKKKTAMSTQTGATGGFAVPPQHLMRLLQLVTEMSIVRSGGATVIQMTGREVDIPVLNVFGTPTAGDTPSLGGVVARWTEEVTSKPETEPDLKQLKLTNYELAGFSKLSNTLLDDDAIGLESLLYQLFGKAVAWHQDHAFIRGDGVGKPEGLLNWTGKVSVDRSAASAVSLADVSNMFGRLMPAEDGSVKWLIHPTVVPKLIQMVGGDNMIMISNDAKGQPVWQILGYQAARTQKVPALNTAGDITLVDLSKYLIGDRQQIEIAFSEHVAFLTNQSVWRFVSRVAGKMWMKDKVTLTDASSTLSPVVTLAAG